MTPDFHRVRIAPFLIHREREWRGNNAWFDINRFHFRAVWVLHQDPCPLGARRREQSVRISLRQGQITSTTAVFNLLRVGVFRRVGDSISDSLADVGQLSTARRVAVHNGRVHVFQVGVGHQIGLIPQFQDHLEKLALLEVLDSGHARLRRAFLQEFFLVVALDVVARRGITTRVSGAGQIQQ